MIWLIGTLGNWLIERSDWLIGTLGNWLIERSDWLIGTLGNWLIERSDWVTPACLVRGAAARTPVASPDSAAL